MSIEMLRIVSRVLYAMAGIVFLVAIAVFWKFDIYKIVGDLSGRNARKEIRAIGKRKRKETKGRELCEKE